MTVRELAESVGEAVLRRMGRAASRFQEESPIPVDVLESDDEYLVVFDVPGATASDVQVNYTGAEVQVRVERFREYREGYEMLFPGRGLSLDGRAELPGDALVDAEKARAELREDGTLYVSLPKAEDEREEIEVESGDESDESGDAEDADADGADADES